MKGRPRLQLPYTLHIWTVWCPFVSPNAGRKVFLWWMAQLNLVEIQRQNFSFILYILAIFIIMQSCLLHSTSLVDHCLQMNTTDSLHCSVSFSVYNQNNWTNLHCQCILDSLWNSNWSIMSSCLPWLANKCLWSCILWSMVMSAMTANSKLNRVQNLKIYFLEIWPIPISSRIS